jgi:hypothetical protein
VLSLICRRHMKALSALTSVKTLLPVKVAEEPIPIDESVPHLNGVDGSPPLNRNSTENLELFDCRNQFNSLKSRNQRSLPESCWVGVE